MWALLNKFAIGRIFAWMGWSLSAKGVWDWVGKRVGYLVGYTSSLTFWLFPALWEKAYAIFAPGFDAATRVASGPAATIARAMTGLPIDAGAMAKILTGGLSAGERDVIGAGFTAIFDDIFRTGPIAEGNLNRLPGPGEREAFERFVGRNAQLQMAGIMAGLVKDRLPKNLTLGLGDIVERTEKIMGFEDSQEEIMEPLMEKLIVEGLEKHFNRITKPTDLSPEDAISAYIRGYLTDQEVNAILDNEGVRNDVRKHLVNLQAKNLTESDFRDLYQRGTWSRDDVFTGFRGNGYVEDDAEDKTNLVIHDREWILKKELLNCKESQYANGVLDEGGLRTYCTQMGFTAVETDIEVEIAKCKASMGTAKKPKAITGTFNVAPWRVKPGASAVMSWNIRNADSVTISGIGTVDHRGERVIQPTISQTYVLIASSDTDTERFEAVVEVGGMKELKRPTATFSATPGRVTIGTPVELKWVTDNADTVSIDQVGIVGEAGAVPVFPFLTTIYTLRATNAQGTTIRQDIVFVELPSIPDLERLRPAVSFTITPLVFNKAQPRVEVKWGTQRALNVSLEDNLGNKRDVGSNGALIAEPGETGIWTLRATNVFGETMRQEAAIKKQPEEEEPPPPPGGDVPVLLLSVSPGTATPGENLFVFWSITGADVGTLIFADGSSREVGASGNQNISAPGVPGSYEYRLQAANVAGPATMSVVVVVSNIP